MNILITGCNGFVGRHAVALFRQRGHDVFGSDIQAATSLPIPYRMLDIRDQQAVERLLGGIRPDGILHLGGVAFVPMALENPQWVFHVNTIGPLNLLSAMKAEAPNARLLFVTSAEVYGSQAAARPLAEDAPYRPDNLYGVTKAAADHAALLFAERNHLPLLVARPSNHIGVGQSREFVTSAFAAQLAAISRGAEVVMRVGNLRQQRDFTDVRDVVRAYALLLEEGAPGRAYNIASGKPVAIQSVLDMLCDISGVHPRMETDPDLYRPTDQRPTYDTSRIRADVGWAPLIPLRDSLAELYADIHSHPGE
ncbi:MAG: GDP-mannose 4,6-dehydratase [Verrucomicrobiota bacterium]|jgi:GDP-4-dehydro-6-deoxy-D-mannose reductase|nr:GDP-mannose 4,6-dehydratase [Verrucomicrobiota bacterium]